eukprot:CAMPEP_0201621514 /NCGR_PEP_ID=MMETSP0492-20130828/46923_1 /ASSEMBLY_ACC=CAM_ASM_000837 /TAXON_ID=420259 /ORGANISM="Thalassiosira gravida, Strain GMp14c1" /LENGTH=234 /DNA_ID=CAMNT_0048091061 /DNA_START=22 /DNA_END=726 /DNA_ORIENTATION=-
MVNSSILLLAAMASSATTTTAFTTAPKVLVNLVQSSPTIATTTTAIHAHSTTSTTRRDFFVRTTAATVATTFAVTTLAAEPANAASTPPTPEEIQRIKTGYENIQYLLANWEKETTTCRENGGECKRDADPVRKYLGLRSTTDPLFQIEKVFAKVRFMEDIDPDKLEAFFDATEEWNSSMTMTNSMAFISQFGEYNPGGGKDEVLKYLNEAQIQVVLAEKALRVILDCVNSTAP